MHVLQREGWRSHPRSWRERNRTRVSRSSRAIPVPAHPPPKEHKQQQQPLHIPSATNRAVTATCCAAHLPSPLSTPPFLSRGNSSIPPTNATTLGWTASQQPFGHPLCTLKQRCMQQQRAHVSHTRDWFLC